MVHCKNLYLLSTISCQLAECLSEDELAALSADLVVLGDMLANILAHQAKPCVSVSADTPSAMADSCCCDTKTGPL